MAMIHYNTATSFEFYRILNGKITIGGGYIDPIVIDSSFPCCYSLAPPGTPMLGSQHLEFPTKILEDHAG